MNKEKIAPGMGNRQPKWKLDHIETFASVRSATRLAREADVSISFVYYYCEQKGIQLNKRPYVEEKNTYFIDKIKRFKKQEPIVRPPAVYGNKSREEKIEELLSMGTGHD